MSSEVKYPELHELLDTTKARDITTSHEDVVEVTVDMTPLEASKKLWENKVIGAPVWDEANQKYIGFFDVREMLSTVIASHKEEEANSTKKQYTKWFEKKPMDTMPCGTPLNVKYLAARNPFVPVQEDATLREICQVSATRHAHRVPVVDKETGRCIRIISQATLVKFIVSHLLDNDKHELRDTLFKQTLEEAKFPYKKPQIYTAPDTATACDVFELMDSKRLSGIAIVDEEDGAHVGSTNAFDIRLAVAVDDEATFDLGMNIMSFLSAVRQTESARKTRYPTAHIKETGTTVGGAIRKLAKTGLHRIFVVDTWLVPIGVIGVSDVVGFLANEGM